MADQLHTDSFFWGPPPAESFRDRVLTYASFFGPLADIHCSTIRSYKSLSGWLIALAAIIALFFAGGPPDIAWLVMAFVVYAIQRMPWRWAQAQLGEELLERHEAESNSAPAVAIPTFGIWIGAAMLCLMVSHVLGGSIHPVFATSLSSSMADGATQTTARFGPSIREQCSTYVFRSSATALACPGHVFGNNGVSVKHLPSSETLA